METKNPPKMIAAPFGLKEIGYYQEENQFLREQVQELQSQLYENRNAYKFLLQDYENALHQVKRSERDNAKLHDQMEQQK